MKRLWIPWLLLFVFAAYQAPAQKKLLKTHPDVIQFLAELKESAETTASAIKKWQDSKGVKRGKQLYDSLKAKESGIMARYKSLIQTPKILKKTDENIISKLNDLTKINEMLRKYYEDNYEKYEEGLGAAANIGDSISGIGGTIVEIIKAIGAIAQLQKDELKKQVDDQILKKWDAIE